MALLNDDIREQLTDHLAGLTQQVNMLLFVDDCQSCDDTKGLLEEVSALSDNIDLTIEAIDGARAEKFGIARTPVIMFVDDADEDLRIRFNGIPAGHEFSAFITTLSEVGAASEALPEELAAKINSIDRAVDIKVFVTLGCPHCSGAVAKAHKLALMNANIRSEMIECGTFPELADQYSVTGVPKIVINDTEELVGNQPIEQFLSAIDNLA